MKRLPFRESLLVPAALLAATGIALAACGSSGGGSGNSTPATNNTSPTSQSSTPAAGAEPASGAGAVAAIKKNWATFFNAKTPTSQRLALLQDGNMLADVIKAQSHNPLAKMATAK